MNSCCHLQGISIRVAQSKVPKLTDLREAYIYIYIYNFSILSVICMGCLKIDVECGNLVVNFGGP